MDYPIKIPQDYSKRERLEEAVKSIVCFVYTDAVYVSITTLHENFHAIITIIVSENNNQDLEDYQRSKIIDVYPECTFKFFTADWTKHAFNKGLPYFVEHCSLDNLVYAAPDVKVFYPSYLITNQYVKRVKHRLEEMAWGTDACVKNYKDLNRSDKTLEAAYCLHQGLRYLFMSLSELFGDSFIGSNCLIEQYEWIIDFVPAVRDCVDLDKPTDREFIEFLNSAYYAIYFKEAFVIEKESLQLSYEKVTNLIVLSRTLLNDRLVSYKTKLKASQAKPFLDRRILNEKMDSNYTIDSALSQIGDIIYDYIDTRSAFCFGYRPFDKVKKHYRSPGFHFYIVVFTQEFKDGAASVIEAKVRNLLNGKHKVTILLHRKESIRKKRDNDRWFLNKLTVNGLQIGNNLEIEDRAFTRDIQESVCYWYDRQLAADSFFSSAQMLTQDNGALIKNTLLHQAVVNLSLGLIELYLSYRPNRINIGHLFSVLQYIFNKDFTADFKDGEDSALYVLLTANPDMARYKDVKQYSITDSNKLEAICQRFCQSATTLADEQIQKLKNSNI